jgi:hypothetical protein
MKNSDAISYTEEESGAICFTRIECTNVSSIRIHDQDGVALRVSQFIRLHQSAFAVCPAQLKRLSD